MKTIYDTTMKIIFYTLIFSFTSTISLYAQNEILTGVENSLNIVQSRTANILCPEEYSEAVFHYNEAKANLVNGESISEVNEELGLAAALVQKINLELDEKVNTFSEIIAARNQALVSKADKYALSYWSSAESEFRGAVEDYSDGDISDAMKDMPHCIMLYNNARDYSSYADSLVLHWPPLQNSNSTLANLISPGTYNDAFYKFNEALEQFSTGEELSSIDRLVNQSGILFNQAADNSRVFAERYNEVIPTRTSTLESGAARYAPYLWLEAEEALMEAGQSFEENETEETPELVDIAVQKYRAAKNFVVAAQLFPDLQSLPRVFSWNLGFGFDYPRYISTSLSPEEGGYGGSLAIQRIFSEYTGLRLTGNYLHLEGKANGGTQKTDLIIGNLDFIFNFVPFTNVSPYFFFGAGGMLFMIDDKLPGGTNEESDFAYQLNFGVGVESRLSETLKLKTELGFHMINNTDMDGLYGPNPGGLLGGNTDTYSKFEIGLNYYFGKGKPSGYYDLYKGISARPSEINYDRIENIVKKYQVNTDSLVDYERFEDIVQKYQSTGFSADDEAPVLVGINFETNSTRIEAEAAPVLYYNAQILFRNPGMKVEIHGYTDNVGAESTNQKLSLQRAMSVKNYLVAVGVEENRLLAVGFGSRNPLANNTKPEGRSMNRRVEFKIIAP